MEHQYCLLYKNDRLQFGWIRESKKNRFVVVPEQGQEITCSQSRLEHVWKGQNIEEQKKALSFLRSRSQVLIEQSSNIELDVIHELCEPGNSYTLDELAENFLDELGNPYEKIIFDKNGTQAIEWGAFGVPESFLIYNERVIKKYIGPLNNELIKEIKLIIK